MYRDSPTPCSQRRRRDPRILGGDFRLWLAAVAVGEVVAILEHAAAEELGVVEDVNG